MKAKVLQKFIDKHTNKLNEVGTIIEVSKERLAEILAAGNYVEVVKTRTTKTKK